MYNKESKMEFLSEFEEANQSRYQSIFKRTKKLETEVGQDIAYIDTEKISQHMLADNKSTTFSTFSSNMYLIAAYRKWLCDNNGEQNPIQFTSKELREYFNKYNSFLIFHNPAELKERIDEFAPQQFIDMVTFNDIIRVFYELSYNGLSRNEILNLKLTNIQMHKKSATILLGGRKIKIHKEFAHDIIHLYENRLYAKNSNQYNNSAIVLDDNYYINTGNGETPKVMSQKIVNAIKNRKQLQKTKDIPRESDILIMGEIYRYIKLKKYTSIDSISRAEAVSIFYEDSRKASPSNKNKIYTILENW